MEKPARLTVLQGGREKAYRPLPAAERAVALEAGIATYGQGEYFEAHEILEPAWMGTDDPAERDLYQGLIKLSAAFVHATRGNPSGVAKNLRGARERLGRAGPAGPAARDDVAPILDEIDEWLANPRALDAPWTAIPIRRLGTPPGEKGESAGPSSR